MVGTSCGRDTQILRSLEVSARPSEGEWDVIPTERSEWRDLRLCPDVNLLGLHDVQPGTGPVHRSNLES